MYAGFGCVQGPVTFDTFFSRALGTVSVACENLVAQFSARFQRTKNPGGVTLKLIAKQSLIAATFLAVVALVAPPPAAARG